MYTYVYPYILSSVLVFSAYSVQSPQIFPFQFCKIPELFLHQNTQGLLITSVHFLLVTADGDSPV